jgi:hypothetical protein
VLLRTVHGLSCGSGLSKPNRKQLQFKMCGHRALWHAGLCALRKTGLVGPSHNTQLEAASKAHALLHCLLYPLCVCVLLLPTLRWCIRQVT